MHQPIHEPTLICFCFRPSNPLYVSDNRAESAVIWLLALSRPPRSSHRRHWPTTVPPPPPHSCKIITLPQIPIFQLLTPSTPTKCEKCQVTQTPVTPAHTLICCGFLSLPKRIRWVKTDERKLQSPSRFPCAARHQNKSSYLLDTVLSSDDLLLKTSQRILFWVWSRTPSPLAMISWTSSLQRRNVCQNFYRFRREKRSIKYKRAGRLNTSGNNDPGKQKQTPHEIAAQIC